MKKKGWKISSRMARNVFLNKIYLWKHTPPLKKKKVYYEIRALKTIYLLRIKTKTKNEKKITIITMCVFFFDVPSTVCLSFDDALATIDLLSPPCAPCLEISNANSMAYFRTDFSYIQPAIRLIESYVTWLNITKEITFVFTNQKGKMVLFFLFFYFFIVLSIFYVITL